MLLVTAGNPNLPVNNSYMLLKLCHAIDNIIVSLFKLQLCCKIDVAQTMIICILAPVARCFLMTSLRNIISVNFIVISSSLLQSYQNVKQFVSLMTCTKTIYNQQHRYRKFKYSIYINYKTLGQDHMTYVPDLRSDTTDGRIHIGGTRMRVRMRSSGRPDPELIISRAIS